MRVHQLIISCLCAAVFITCSKREGKEIDVVTFPLKGEVVALDTVKKTITISHEEIPNYMQAMTMPFKVKQVTLLRGVAVGDSVAATLAVSRTESWLETLSVSGRGSTPKTLTADELVLMRVFRPGQSFPDEKLTNQEGKPIRFSDFRGKALLLTFIYTRCPLPDFCIRMSNHFAKLQKILGSEHSLDGRWHLITISFDPLFDSPRILKDYARKYHADLATWDFATDPDSEGSAIMRLADGLGLTYAEDQGLIAHNLRTVLIDKEGKLIRVINGNEWTPDEVAAEIRDIARKE